MVPDDVPVPPATTHRGDDYRTETVFAWSGPAVRFGHGSSNEIGPELRALGASSTLVVTDRNVRELGVAEEVATQLQRAGLRVSWWDGVEPEPRASSVLAAHEALAQVQVDSYVAVGGGSCIDTCKVLNLLRTYGGQLTDWLAPPHGEGAPIPGPLAPMMAVPTTAGTGSETTSTAILEVDSVGVKAAVADGHIRPTLAFIDPRNVVTCPPAVTASTGYDIIVQAIESLTARPFDQRPARNGQQREVYAGSTPITDMWSERSLLLAARSFERSIGDGTDLEARTDMCLAALFGRYGNAGVHIPHAAGYAVAALAKGYRAPDYQAERDFVPHGVAVASVAAASLEATFDGCPGRHLQAAEILGVPQDVRASRPSTCLSEHLQALIRRTGGPPGLSALGLGVLDLPRAAEIAAGQERLMASAPVELTHADLEGIFKKSG